MGSRANRASDGEPSPRCGLGWWPTTTPTGTKAVTSDTTPVPPLALGTRLLHIGIPKTGTTALQTAAAQHRAELAKHGVCYPGRRAGNHREAVCALMGRRLGWAGAGDYVPDIRLWEQLLAEVERRPDSRTLISHEFASESDDEQARRFRDSLGESIHVVITLRGFAWLLSSSWQQYVKAGRRQSFDRWLKAILVEMDRAPAPGFYKRNDQAAIVRRWADVVGPDRLTVVIADKQRPNQLTDAFEDMLGLPRGLLHTDDGGGLAANRSLSLPEAELIRKINSVFRAQDYSWQEYTGLIRNGAVARLLEGRRPAANEPKIVLPQWAAEKATEKARHYAEGIEAVGCRVIGDLTTLYAPIPSTPGKPVKIDTVPMDVAVQAMSGLLSASSGRGAFFDLESTISSPSVRRLSRSRRVRHWLQTSQVTANSSVADLLAVAGVRAASRLRSRLGR
ncbi:MAG: hypothetical protein AVDCRST_MAG75-926 [uncultured Propionibacteriaceae bacterium]|uniref:Sulfotransferase family protein n=1 Tax=uncultured Propionibacteriaceae bacterium TaxID=257457 RepID=A0A6J4N8K5_9ACTN|nr:MAG: hypothetical protein AVDCRST_MAG75-926 [uncultured Propionibacteriaceae bacterium]